MLLAIVLGLLGLGGGYMAGKSSASSSISAEITKLVAAAKAEESDLVAKLKALLAKL